MLLSFRCFECDLPFFLFTQLWLKLMSVHQNPSVLNQHISIYANLRGEMLTTQFIFLRAERFLWNISAAFMFYGYFSVWSQLLQVFTQKIFVSLISSSFSSKTLPSVRNGQEPCKITPQRKKVDKKIFLAWCENFPHQQLPAFFPIDFLQISLSFFL